MLVVCCLFQLYVNGQDDSLNNYKYVLVDDQYEFQKHSNQFQLNDLAVFELEKRGFEAFLASDTPLSNLQATNGCQLLKMDLQKSGFIGIKLIFTLSDCNGNLVFTSKEGYSKIKDYQKAYFAALREAMTSLDDIDYEYQINEESISAVDVSPDQMEPMENLSESVQEMEMTTEQESAEKLALEKSMQEQASLIAKDLVSTDGTYSLIASMKGYTVFQGDQLIGMLKKSNAGCYLAVTSSFVGIAYESNMVMFIEYEKGGKDMLLKFVKP